MKPGPGKAWRVGEGAALLCAMGEVAMVEADGARCAGGVVGGCGADRMSSCGWVASGLKLKLEFVPESMLRIVLVLQLSRPQMPTVIANL